MQNERKIEALRNMAKSGTKHEREAAKAILDRMNIEEQDEEPVEYFTVSFGSEFERKLICQTAAMMFNTFNTPMYRRSRARNKLLIKCTKREFVEFDLVFESYRRALKEELEITVSAFIQKNKIFPAEAMASPSRDPITERDRKILERAGSVDRVTVRKQIAGRAE